MDQYNQDNDSDIFDPFLALVRASKHFDQDDIACVEETRREHQKHVETRIQMDKALHDTKQFLIGRMQKLQEFEHTVPVKVKSSPAYKHFFSTFAQKQVQIEQKYKELREKREAIYGKYETPPSTPVPSPYHSPSNSIAPPSSTNGSTSHKPDVGLPCSSPNGSPNGSPCPGSGFES